MKLFSFASLRLCQRSKLKILGAILRRNGINNIRYYLRKMSIAFKEKSTATHLSDSRRNDNINNPDTIENILRELNDLIGLKQLKSGINNLISFLKIQQKRQEFGLSKVPITLHFVFRGSPEMGKIKVTSILYG